MSNQFLLFSIVDGLSSENEKVVKEWLLDAPLHEWVSTSPELVDHFDATSCTQEGDEPIRTLGLVLTLSATDISSLTNLAVIEREDAQLIDTKAAVQWFSALSKMHAVTVEVELNGVFVGEIDRGRPNRGIRDLLLGEWEKVILAARNALQR